MTEVRKQMHQTTVRFDSELWSRVEQEAQRIGVSAAQYIRDSTLIRLTQEALSARAELPADPGAVPEHARVISTSALILTESSAVWAQARQARERARAMREASRQLTEARTARSGSGRSGSDQATIHDEA